jgi:hypothetical protein
MTNIVDAEGVAFVNDAGGERGEPHNLDHTICFECGGPGHYANSCPNRNQGEQGGTNLCTGTEESADSNGWFSFSQSGAQDIPASWMLQDNQSMIALFCNRKLLVNIRPSSTHMNVCCNASGQCTTTMVGDLPGYGTIWYDPKSIANILS